MKKCIQGIIVVCCFTSLLSTSVAQTPSAPAPAAALPQSATEKKAADAAITSGNAETEAKTLAEAKEKADAKVKAAKEAQATAEAEDAAPKELSDNARRAFVKRYMGAAKGRAFLEEPVNPSGIPYHVFLSSGAVFQNPYHIKYDSTANTAVLEKGGTSTRPFLEFGYYNRFVIRTDDPDPKAPTTTSRFGLASGNEGNAIRGEGAIQWVNPLVRFPDIDTRLGFVFNSDSSGDSFSASTIAGSGDFYSQSSIGLPILRYTQPNSEWVNTHQVTIEVSGGITTDKEFLAVHPNAFVGLGYQTAFAPFGSKHERSFFFGRIGYGWANAPVLLPGNGLGVKVENNLPKFELEGSVALGAYLSFPLSKTIYLNLGANAYLTDNPAMWNITAGVTIPLASFGKVFKSIIGSDDEKKSQ